MSKKVRKKKVVKKKGTRPHPSASAKGTSNKKKRPPATRRGVRKPRPAEEEEEYSFGQDGSSSRGMRGNKILIPGVDVDLVSPQFTGKTGTTFRMVPCIDRAIKDEDVWAPTRRSCKAKAYHDFIRAYPVMRYWGKDERLTFILYDPRWLRKGDYDRFSNPAICLEMGVRQAVKENELDIRLGNRSIHTQNWPHFVSKDNRNRPFTGDNWQYFIQGVIFEHDGKILVQGTPPLGVKTKDRCQLITVSKSAGEALIEQLELRKPGYKGPTDNVELFVYPDPTSLVDGLWVTFFNADEQSPPGEGTIVEDDDGEEDLEEETMVDSTAGNKKKGGDWSSWSCQLSETFKYVNKGKKYSFRRDLTEWDQKIYENVQYWQDIIHVPSHEEIAGYCARAFRSQADMLKWAWRDHDEYLKFPDVVALLAARTQGPGAEIPADEEEEEHGTPVEDAPRTRSSAALAEGGEEEEYDETEYEGEEGEEEVEYVYEEDEEGSEEEGSEEEEEVEYEEDEYEEEGGEEEEEEEEDPLEVAAAKAKAAANRRAAQRSPVAKKKVTKKKKVKRRKA